MRNRSTERRTAREAGGGHAAFRRSAGNKWMGDKSVNSSAGCNSVGSSSASSSLVSSNSVGSYSAGHHSMSSSSASSCLDSCSADSYSVDSGSVSSSSKGSSASRFRLIGLIAASAVMLAGCGQSGSVVPADLQALYTSRCLSCHGEKLEGRVGDRTNLIGVGARMTREQIAAQIADGGELMPGFGDDLAAEDISALTDWLAGQQ